MYSFHHVDSPRVQGTARGTHLNEGHGLDVTHSPAQLDDTHIRLVRPTVHWLVRHPLNPVLSGSHLSAVGAYGISTDVCQVMQSISVLGKAQLAGTGPTWIASVMCGTTCTVLPR